MVLVMLLHLETSSVRRRLQCCSSRNRDLEGPGSKGQTEGALSFWATRGDSPVGHVVTTGEVEVLQPVEVRRRLGDPAVADPGAVAERQAGEAAAVPRHRHQAGVADLRQRRQG